ncbi:CopG family transcriptional regulator [Alistipes sp. OttesenSCG-928-B03]|nr:CopG family transcriptional regulator [Alistipes sp. OttesenSCG-928-B03]
MIINVYWDKNYSAIPANDEMAVAVTGKTLDEIKERMEFSLQRHVASMQTDGDPIPAEFQGEYELEYHLDALALLHYTEGIVSRKALAQVTGINQQQLSHYARGWRKPRPEMQKRIEAGIHELGQQLLAVSM